MGRASSKPQTSSGPHGLGLSSRDEMASSAAASAELALFTGEQIKRRVQRIGSQITEDYDGMELLLVGVLKGGATFTVDLARAIELPLAMDWVAVSRYGRGSIGGEPSLLKDVSEDVAGRNVLIVEDIVDTGVTLFWLMNHIWAKSPASVHCCVLLRKPHAVERMVEPKYVGFDIFVHWVAGYGIDYAERYRNLGDIHEVRIADSSAGVDV
jgi:hypoxanthine phosphoribosyltransferase